MASNYARIEAIQQNSRNWIVRTTVLECLPRIRLEENREMQRYILADEEGTEVVASVHSDDIALITPNIHRLDVLDISNVEVVRTHPPHQIVEHPNEWILRENNFAKIENGRPDERPLMRNLVLLSQLTNTLNSGNLLANIMAVVIKVHHPTSKKIQAGWHVTQKFLIVDIGNEPTELTIRNSLVDEYSHQLIEAYRQGYVFIGRRVRLSRNQGITIVGNHSTSFIVNPQGEQAEFLQTWYLAVAESMIPLWRRIHSERF